MVADVSVVAVARPASVSAGRSAARPCCGGRGRCRTRPGDHRLNTPAAGWPAGHPRRRRSAPGRCVAAYRGGRLDARRLDGSAHLRAAVRPDVVRPRPPSPPASDGLRRDEPPFGSCCDGRRHSRDHDRYQRCRPGADLPRPRRPGGGTRGSRPTRARRPTHRPWHGVRTRRIGGRSTGFGRPA